MSIQRAVTAFLPLFCLCGPVLFAQPAPDAAVSTAAAAMVTASSAPVPAAVSTAAAASEAPVLPFASGENILRHSEKYYDDLAQAAGHITALYERWEKCDPAALGQVVKDIAALDEKIKALLGPEAMKELDEKDRPRREGESVSIAKALVAGLRQAIQQYHFDSDGAKFPKTLADLAPRYLDIVPELNLVWHGKTSAVTPVETAKFDKDFSQAVKDTGGWLYFSDPRSANWGMVVIDCSHKDRGGTELYKY